jgi:hypothetical protein
MAPEYPVTEEAVRSLVDAEPYASVVERLSELAEDQDPRSLDALRAILTWRANDTYAKHDVPRLAARALLAHGPGGVDVLRATMPQAPGAIYPSAILEVFWRASRNLDDPLGPIAMAPEEGSALLAPVDEVTAAASRAALADLLVEALVDDDRMTAVVGLMQALQVVEGEAAARDVLEQITESSIRLTPSLIEEFEALIASAAREEDYQTFFVEHPVFLDPLAAEVVPKQRLGLEHISDFAVRRHDGRWLLVEIEKPRDRIMNRSNDFTSEFVHGFGQVLDFQQWVEAHGEYARDLMAHIASPRGLLIIGRRPDLTPDGATKLRRFVANSATIDVLTYDDVLANARALYASIHHRDAAAGA